MSDKPDRLLLQLSLGFAVFTVLLTLVFFGWWGFKDRFMFGDEPFDTVQWMAAKHPSECARGDMVHDIQRNLLFPGMQKSAVMARLGRPDWEEGRQIEYELGVCLWIVHGLRLYFDEQGMLVHHAIVQH